ncbi:MAG: hypothetical protein IRY91_15025 [Gemmatimonadaceae bacterium]|nr:hypothetical protein [Gemmatimonadaceae bacterium]
MRALGTVSLVSLVICVLRSSPAAAQGRPASTWAIGLEGTLGAPSGWVQVREGTLDGTRLHFRRDLGVRRTHTLALDVAYHPARGSGFELSLASYTLNGTTRLTRDVLFNGTTLAAGSTLATRTDFPNFLRIDVAWRKDFFAIGRGGTVSGTLGLTAMLLTFKLRGTIAPTSVGRETKEDFVTQELPVPIIGVRVRYPLAERFVLRARISGGYLPWINSLRNEGGVVRLTQSHLDVDLGGAYAIARSWQVVGGYRRTELMQREKSREDGNDIRLGANLVRLGVVRRF